MLPPDPPKPSHRDFDPSTVNPDEDIDMNDEDADDEGGNVELSSVEINILVYLYLLESNFPHTAFTLLSESSLPSTSLFQHFHPSFPTASSSSSKNRSSQPNGTTPQTPSFGRPSGRIERGELVRRLWKGLRWEEVERHVQANGELYKPQCPNPFHLLVPHTCPPGYPSATHNPPMPFPSSLRLSPPLPRRNEAFPPPPQTEESQAGPSSSRDKSDKMKATATQTETSLRNGKRKTRRMSNGSTSTRQPSPARSTSPAKDAAERKEKGGGKKRARVSDAAETPTEEMDVEEEKERKGGKKGRANGSPAKTSLKVRNGGEDGKRAKSPMGKVKGKGKAKDEDDEGEEDGVVIWKEHRDYISCVAWNPKNHDVLITGSADATARLWEFSDEAIDGGEDGEKKKVLRMSKSPAVINHKGIESGKKSITAVDWHPDGTVFATGAQDGVGRLFTPSGQLQGIMSYGRGAITSLRFSPSGSRILTSKSDHTICLWSVGNAYQQSLIRSFESHGMPVNDVDWLDDEVFASAGDDHCVFVFRWNEKRPRFTFRGHGDDVTRIRWSPRVDGVREEDRLLASASDDGHVMVWKLPSYPSDRGTSAGSRSESPSKGSKGGEGEDDWFDNKQMNEGKGAGGEGCLQRLKVVEGSEDMRMRCVEWGNEPGRFIVAAGGQDSPVKLFDALSGQTLHTLKGLESGTGSIAFSPTGFRGSMGAVAGGGWDGRVMIWDVESGEVLKEWDMEEDEKTGRDRPMMLSMAWREDGEHLVVGRSDKALMAIYVGDLRTPVKAE